MASWEDYIGQIVHADCVDILRYFSKRLFLFPNRPRSPSSRPGSGTVAVACYLTGRRFIAVEKNAIYWEKSVARLRDAQRQPMLL